ncbi:MAG TPA: DUF4340 domain-containing protein [Acetobacteraceae bacterium]|jgi:hypothetical protein
MTPRTLAILVVLGVVALGGGWYFGIGANPGEQRSVDAGKLMYPGLTTKLQAATRIEIVHQGKSTVIEKRPDGQWGLADRNDYRVQDTKLHGMLTALTELRLMEPRTTDPKQYARLGVEDPSGKDATSDLLRVLDAGGMPIVSIIVGHRRVRTQGNVPDEVYVRRPDDMQVWLAQGGLQVDADPQQWFDRDVLNIEHSRIAGVVVTHPDQTLVFKRDGEKLVLEAPADHPKLDNYKQEDVARALELLTLQDVRPDKDKIGDSAGQAVFTTSDGLAVTATVSQAGKDVWARFAVTGKDKAAAEAAKLSAKLSGWIYQIGSWKEKSLVPTLDDLKAAPPAKPEAGAPTDAPSPAPAK